MPLEATVVCLDNSEWMRNGDYTPTRMEAQHDAVNLICGAKTQQNPESTVGCIAGAGKSPEVLVTLTPDLGKMLSALHNIKLQPTLNFPAAVQVAQLVLKHRQNKNQQQRIIFFVGSPVNSDVNEMVRLAKRLKKNNIAVDIVNFGEQEENTEKLESFIQNVNNNENSHLVNIPPGPHILSDIIISSPIITGGEDTSAGSVPGSTTGTAAQDFSMYGGVDPNLDPELAMALKVSLEEARAQQEAQAKKDQPADATNTNTTTTASSETAPVNTTTDTMDVDDEAELAKALALSMTQTPSTESGSTTSGVTAAPLPTPAPTTTTQQQDTDMGELEDDEDMRLALQMSMQSNNPTSTNNDVDISKVMEDPNFVNSVLSSLPGVDPNDETIKNVLASIGKSDEKKDDKDKK